MLHQSLEDLVAVLGRPEVTPDLVTGVDALVRQSMVNVVPDRHGWLRMLQAVRQYVVHRLDEAPTGEVVRVRHAEWAVQIACGITQGSDISNVRRQIVAMKPDLLAAVHKLMDRSPECAVNGLIALSHSWELHMSREEHNALLAAVEATRTTHPVAHARALYVLTWRGFDIGWHATFGHAKAILAIGVIHCLMAISSNQHDDQVHRAGFVEKALEDDRLPCWHRAQSNSRGD